MISSFILKGLVILVVVTVCLGVLLCPLVLTVCAWLLWRDRERVGAACVGALATSGWLFLAGIGLRAAGL